MGLKEQLIEIKLSPKRADIDQLIKGRSIYSEEHDDFFDQLETYPDIQIFERRSKDVFYKCAQFVFGKIYQEPWCGVYQDTPLDLWCDPVKFLRKNNFEIVSKPQEKDVVIYGDFVQNEFLKKESFQANHFGIYQSNNFVLSKFGAESVIKHPLEVIPSDYGSQVLFMRKNL